jgi:hypothetical protein
MSSGICVVEGTLNFGASHVDVELSPMMMRAVTLTIPIPKDQQGEVGRWILTAYFEGAKIEIMEARS